MKRRNIIYAIFIVLLMLPLPNMNLIDNKPSLGNLAVDNKIPSTPEKQIEAIRTAGTSWVFTDLHYRLKTTITTTVDLHDYPLDIFVDFDSYGYHPTPESIRVTDEAGNEIPSQVWNTTDYDGSHISSATVTFLVNATAGSTLTFYIYFDEEYAAPPVYPEQVKYWAVPGGYPGDYYFNGTNYKYARTWYQTGGKLWDVYHYPGDYISTLPSTYGWAGGYAESVSYNGWNWNPDVYTSTWYSTSNSYHDPGYIEEAGPLFVTYVTPRMTMGSYGNVSTKYRFFKWGFLVETNITWLSTSSASFFRMNEWVFEKLAFTHMFYGYDPSNPTITELSPSSSSTSPALYDTQTAYLGFINVQWGYSAGAILISTINHGVTYSTNYYVLHHVITSYDYWDRRFNYPSWTAGSWIYEKYAILIWDARADTAGDALAWFLNRILQFLNPPSIYLDSTVEIYEVSIPIKVVDLDSEPIEGAIVSLINDTSNEVVDVQYTNSSGIALLKTRAITQLYDLNITIVSHNKKYEKFLNREILVTGDTPVLDLRTYQFDLHKVLIRVFDGARVTHVYNATIRFINNTDSTDYIEGTTDGNGWVQFYIRNGTWNISVYYLDNLKEVYIYNATSSIGYNESTDILLAGPVTVYTHDLQRNIDLLIEIRYLSLPPPAYFAIVNGSTFYDVEWGETIYLEVLLHDKNMTAIDVYSLTNSYIKWAVMDLEQNILASFPLTNMSEISLGHYTLSIDTSKLKAGNVYNIYVVANLSTHYTSPDPLYIPIKVNPVRTEIEIRSLPSSISYGERLYVEVYYGDVNGNALTDADVNLTIGDRVYELTYDNAKGAYILEIQSYTDLAPGIYNLEIEACKGNYTSQTRNRILLIDSRSTELSVYYEDMKVSSIRIYYKDIITLYIDYIDGINGSAIRGAIGQVNLIKYLSAQEYVALTTVDLIWNETAGKYQATLNLTEIDTGVYELSISIGKQYYYYQSQTLTFIIDPIKTRVITSSDYVEIYWGESVNITFEVLNLVSGELVSDLSYSITKMKDGKEVDIPVNFVSEGDRHVLIFDSRNYEPGLYQFNVTFTKDKYSINAKSISIKVKKVPISAEIEMPVSVELNPVGLDVKVSFVLRLYRGYDRVPLENATIYIRIKDTELEESMVMVEPGKYVAELNVKDLEPNKYIVEFEIKYVIINGAQSETASVSQIESVKSPQGTSSIVEGPVISIDSLNVDYVGGSITILGKKYPTLIVVPSMLIITVVAGVFGFRYYLWLKLPAEVKELVKLINNIKKDIYEYSAPGREDVFKELLTDALKLKK